MARKSVHLALLLSAVVMGFAVGRYRDSTANRVSRQPLYYVDPMHRDYRSNKPGIAPDCGMQLVAVYSEDISGALTGARTSPSGQIRISAASQQLYGIQLTSVRRSSAHEVVRVLGRHCRRDGSLSREPWH